MSFLRYLVAGLVDRWGESHQRPLDSDDEGRGYAKGKPVEPSAKVTIEFPATACLSGACRVVARGHDVRQESFTMRGEASDDARPLFRDGARGEWGIVTDGSAGYCCGNITSSP